MQVCYFEKSSMGDPKTQFWGVFLKNLPVNFLGKGTTFQILGFWVPPTCIKKLEHWYWAHRVAPLKYLAWGSSFLGVFYRSVENSQKTRFWLAQKNSIFGGSKLTPFAKFWAINHPKRMVSQKDLRDLVFSAGEQFPFLFSSQKTKKGSHGARPQVSLWGPYLGVTMAYLGPL